MSRVDRLLAGYAAYHRHPANRATHAVGIPLIVYALMVALAMVPLPGFPGWCPLLVPVVAVAAGAYLRLDTALGLAVSCALALTAALAIVTVTAAGTGTAAVLGVATFAGGWVFQLIGHWIEGRRPALADNLLQVFVAPVFLAAEAAAVLGLRRHPGAGTAAGDGG